MKILLFSAVSLLLSFSAHSKPQIVVGKFDLTNNAFGNHCLQEGAVALDGSTVQGVFVFESNGRIRLVNRAVGQAPGYGAISGDELIISLAMDNIPNEPNGAALDDRGGVVQFMYRAHVVNLSNPDSGVSMEKTKATFLFEDGVFRIVGGGNRALVSKCTRE